jgi:hypothetical protein
MTKAQILCYFISEKGKEWTAKQSKTVLEFMNPFSIGCHKLRYGLNCLQNLSDEEFDEIIKKGLD